MTNRSRNRITPLRALESDSPLPAVPWPHEAHESGTGVANHAPCVLAVVPILSHGPLGSADEPEGRRTVTDAAVGVSNVEQLRALPHDGRAYEMLEGRVLVVPMHSWSHWNAIELLTHLVAPYVAEHAVGEVRTAPAEVQFDDQNLVIPDLFVCAADASCGPAEPFRGVPLVVVEVLSRSTARIDRGPRRECYQRARIPLYWAVDLDDRLIEAWQPDDARPAVRRDWLSWQPDPGVPPLQLYLPAFFSEALRED